MYIQLSFQSAQVFNNGPSSQMEWLQYGLIFNHLDIPSTVVLSLALPQIRFHHILTVYVTINITSLIIYMYSVIYSLKNKCLNHSIIADYFGY